MTRRKFTPEQANRTLPLVRRIVADLLDRARERHRLSNEAETPDTLQRLESLNNEVQELTSELEGIGCYFKDWNLEAGLVDFPAEIDGEEVLLCWRSDEEAIEWYHTYEDGYSGRKRIQEQSPGA